MTPDEQHQADRLGAYADAWLAGRIGEPESAEEATFARLQRVLGTSQAPTPTETFSTQEESTMTPSVPITAPGTPETSRYRTPAMATLARWQPAISFAIMLVLIGGLLAVAWDRQTRNPDPTPTMFAALQDDATPVSGACAKPPPAATEEEIRNFTFDDWSPPQYYATGYADEETADRARQMIQGYWFCGGGVAAADYQSTRARHGNLYDELAPDQQAAILAYVCLPRERDVLQYFPLTLNTQRIDPVWEGYPYSLWNNADVYLLGDGRYGMAMGKLTTDIVRDPSMALSQDYLWFVAFVEENGQLYIDESFYAFSGDPSLYSYGQMSGDCD